MKAETPNIQSWSDALHFLGKSRYRVERAFDALSPDLRKLLLIIADLDLSDLKAGHLTGFKLHHYTTTGQLKIARALRKVRLLSSAFPEGVTEREFLQIDYHAEAENEQISDEMAQ